MTGPCKVHAWVTTAEDDHLAWQRCANCPATRIIPNRR